MPDDSFVETFATYLGMPSPAMRAFTLDPTRPYFIGRSGREQKVDIYGDVVARAEVRGGDFRRSHDELKILFNGMLKHAGFYTTLEARNMFQGKIDARYLDSYCTQHSSVNAIIPDILIHNYKNANDGNSRTACLPAIIDVKTLRVDKNQTMYTPGVHGGRTIKKAVEKKSDQVRTDYKTRVGKLDDKFAPNNQHKPFATAYANTFATGGVMPVIVGAFGEINKHTHRLVINCAKHAAADRDNSDITPEDVASAKGSPYNLILSQFRRALGCLAMRTAADEKLRKIMLIRSSKFEANQAAQNATSNHRRKFNPRSPGWYDNFRNETFHDTFYRYRTTYDNFSYAGDPM